MATNQRIYKVTGLNASYLVQATSQSQALRHIAGKEYQIEVAKAVDVAMLMGKGAKVEVAVTVAEQPDLLTEGEQA